MPQLFLIEGLTIHVSAIFFKCWDHIFRVGYHDVTKLVMARVFNPSLRRYCLDLLVARNAGEVTKQSGHCLAGAVEDHWQLVLVLGWPQLVQVFFDLTRIPIDQCRRVTVDGNFRRGKMQLPVRCLWTRRSHLPSYPYGADGYHHEEARIQKGSIFHAASICSDTLPVKRAQFGPQARLKSSRAE